MSNQETTTVYKIFISHPGDLTPERQALESEIQKFNKTAFRSQNIRVDPLDWENSVHPKSGKPAQHIINEAISSYDMYIGIMGARFGSPTENADSGTEEEYEIAISKHSQNPNSMHVAFFFKNASIGSNASDAEYEQFTKVRDFKKRVQSEGLSKSFSEVTDFVNQAMSLISDFIKAQQALPSSEQDQLLLLAEVPNETVFRIDSDFHQNFLNSPGADLSNGHVKNILLPDIYVPLDFRIMDKTKKQKVDLKVEDAINSEQLISSTSSSFKWVVTGDEKSGKTSFAKMLFNTLHARGFVPVFMRGQEIKNANTEDFQKKVHGAVSAQYSPDSIKAFRELPEDKVVLIIDDYHKSKLNIKHKTQLLKVLHETYKNIVCVADTVFEIDATTSLDSEYRELIHYKKLRLKDAGAKIRFSIIEKWNSLGQEEFISREELDRRNLNAQRIIDQVIRTNFVPCTPFFVLVFLQAIEAGSAEKLSERGFVRYYQFLVDSHLLQSVPDKDVVEIYYAILPEVAYEIFNSNNNALSAEELNKTIERFASLKGISKKDTELVAQGLINHKIIENNSGEYSFRQPYAYYYFLSAYLHSHFDNEKIKAQVKDLCQHLYARQNADIIIFLSYHTNDHFVLNEIMGLAESLFSEELPFNYDKDKNSPINQLVSEGPRLVIDHENSRQIYREGLGRGDTLEETLEEDQPPEQCDSINELDFSAQLNLTFKVSQILGQLLKNHHVKLDKDHKEQMCLTIYNLMLRCLNVIISKFSNNIDELTAELKEFDSRIESEKDARKVLFQFASFITYAFIKSSANVVGAEKLEEIYKGTEQANDSLAVQMINMAIRLDFFKDFPSVDLKRIHTTLDGNILAETCLRLLVGHRMYVRPVEDHAKRQQICDLVGIDSKQQLIQANKKKKVS